MADTDDQAEDYFSDTVDAFDAFAQKVTTGAPYVTALAGGYLKTFTDVVANEGKDFTNYNNDLNNGAGFSSQTITDAGKLEGDIMVAGGLALLITGAIVAGPAELAAAGAIAGYELLGVGGAIRTASSIGQDIMSLGAEAKASASASQAYNNLPAATIAPMPTAITVAPTPVINTTTPPPTPVATPTPTPFTPSTPGNFDPREILYSFNTGGGGGPAQNQVDYEIGIGDTADASQLATALEDGGPRAVAQLQLTQLQGAQVLGQMEQTNPGLDAQIQAALQSEIAALPPDPTNPGTPPAATPSSPSSGGDPGVPSTIPAYVPPSSILPNPVGAAADAAAAPIAATAADTVATPNAVSNPIITTTGTVLGNASATFNVVGNNLNETIAAGNTSPVFIDGIDNYINASTATQSFGIIDLGHSTVINLGKEILGANSQVSVVDFFNDPTGVVNVAGQYASGAAAFAALQSDGQGGMILPLSGGSSVRFFGENQLTAANFSVTDGRAA